VSVGTDSYWSAAPEFAIAPKPEGQNQGMGTLMAIEGLVELGMTPAQAIVAGTKNGAIACHRLDQFGTLEKGKSADLVILDADPLADIHNIRKVRSVMIAGRMVDPATLPERPVLSARQSPLTARNRPLLFTPDAAEMQQKAPDVFKLVERRRAEVIQRYMGKFFADGQRLGMVRKDVPARLIIEILLAMVQSIMNPPKMEELGMMPKEGYTGILKIVLEGALTTKGRKM